VPGCIQGLTAALNGKRLGSTAPSGSGSGSGFSCDILNIIILNY
ncbi:hypothetical protein FOXB_06897, partial [Fusarium oxysporum f. sp. conglutinans Fo5176]